MKKLVLTALTAYQRVISPILHQLLGFKAACRNTPTCSVYAQQSIEKYGAVKGLFLSIQRIVNCQPFFSL